jgi:hypothetical protein
MFLIKQQTHGIFSFYRLPYAKENGAYIVKSREKVSFSLLFISLCSKQTKGRNIDVII